MNPPLNWPGTFNQTDRTRTSRGTDGLTEGLIQRLDIELTGLLENHKLLQAISRFSSVLVQIYSAGTNREHLREKERERVRESSTLLFRLFSPSLHPQQWLV
ncbi:hypothetical protein DBV39_02310 [Orrella marina]|uniref:Uncharacterized protein n=1 Tax=Orrella marina TaxID=2163011 RepID=A0A2R4XG74_9BURK|nr:hypothetical protein DBV39_02310 [Orrella marina]